MAVDLSFFRSETAQRLRGEGRAEGRAADILLLLTECGVDVPDSVRERVTACADLDVLGEWFTRAITVTDAEAIFGVVDDVDSVEGPA